MKTTALFAITFFVGALLAIVVRTAAYDPHSGPSNGAAAPSAPAKSDAHAGHAGHAAAPSQPAPASSASVPPAAGQPVNTLCAICGMAVDPRLPTAEYQGKTIGFGCRMCPPKFRAEPDRYGPLYLRNEVMSR